MAEGVDPGLSTYRAVLSGPYGLLSVTTLKAKTETDALFDASGWACGEMEHKRVWSWLAFQYQVKVFTDGGAEIGSAPIEGG